MSGNKRVSIDFKAAPEKGGLRLVGYASTWEEDRDGEFFEKDSFDKFLDGYLSKNPVVIYEHGMDPDLRRKPLGKIVKAVVDEVGLKVEAWIPEPKSDLPAIVEVYEKIKDGVLKMFSIGGRWKMIGNRIIEAEINETSVVSIPSNRTAEFEVFSKSIKGLLGDTLTLDEARSNLWRVMDTFHSAVLQTTENKDLTPEDRDNAVTDLAVELSSITRSLANTIATAVDKVSGELGPKSANEQGDDSGKQTLSEADSEMLGEALDSVRALHGEVTETLDRETNQGD